VNKENPKGPYVMCTWSDAVLDMLGYESPPTRGQLQELTAEVQLLEARVKELETLVQELKVLVTG
jgi:hypothetical protein